MRSLAAKIILIVVLGFSFCLISFSQSRIPGFQNYPVKSLYNGKNALPKIKKDDWPFRTRIRNGAKQKRNFAGEYVLTQWGCGAECRIAVAINVRTGSVYRVPFTVCCWTIDPGVEPIEYRLKSRLVIFSGSRNESEKDSRNDKHYYEFKNGRFRFLKTIKRK